eukprot:3133746-Rhodomonas_salina.1
MILLGIQLQQILWQVALCLMYYGLSVRSVYIDDEGAAKRMVSVESEDFQLRVEFFLREDVHLNLQVYDLILAPTTCWSSPCLRTSILRTRVNGPFLAPSRATQRVQTQRTATSTAHTS